MNRAALPRNRDDLARLMVAVYFAGRMDALDATRRDSIPDMDEVIARAKVDVKRQDAEYAEFLRLRKLGLSVGEALAQSIGAAA